MSKLLEQTDHATRSTGYMLHFDNGHIWSCVDLSDIGEELPGFNVGEDIGKLYDTMGGRFEAMPVAPEPFIFTERIRAKDMESLVEAVKGWEADDHA